MVSSAESISSPAHRWGAIGGRRAGSRPVGFVHVGLLWSGWIRRCPWRRLQRGGAAGRAVARVVPLGDADQRRVDVDRATIRRILSLPVDEGFASYVDAAEAPVDAE